MVEDFTDVSLIDCNNILDQEAGISQINTSLVKSNSNVWKIMKNNMHELPEDLQEEASMNILPVQALDAQLIMKHTRSKKQERL